MARPCLKLEEAATALTAVERPLNFQSKATVGDESIPRFELDSNMHWASIELMKNMAMGHDVDSLTQFFASLTVHDRSALSLAINRAVSVGQFITQHAASLPSPRADVVEGDNSCYWDMETATASFRTAFDPICNHRRAIIANSRQASIYGMHLEEFQARCASRNLHLPMPDEDLIAVLIYTSVGEQLRRQATAEVFLRLYAGGKGCGTAVLVSARRWVATDALGRITEVWAITAQ